MPLLMIFSGLPFLFGWAKPTPVNPRNFRNLKRGQIIVSGAGPVSNLALAVLFTVALFVAVRLVPAGAPVSPIVKFLEMAVYLNVLLAIFNLVPLPPLDGSHIFQWGLPNGLGHRYIRTIGPYGGYILLALVMTGTLFKVLSPIINGVIAFLYSFVY